MAREDADDLVNYLAGCTATRAPYALTKRDDHLYDETPPQDRGDGWIMTYTGRQFWPLDPRPEDVDIRDIAHALALKCRYGGHCSRFYSVAQHAVLVSQFVRRNVIDTQLYDKRERADLKLWGLLHDAEEAYLADIPRPVKPCIAIWKSVSETVQSAVCDHFQLPRSEPPEVKAIDTAMLWPEMKALMPLESLDRLAHWRTDVLGDFTLTPWPWERAEWEFLKRFDELQAERTT